MKEYKRIHSVIPSIQNRNDGKRKREIERNAENVPKSKVNPYEIFEIMGNKEVIVVRYSIFVGGGGVHAIITKALAASSRLGTKKEKTNRKENTRTLDSVDSNLFSVCVCANRSTYIL